MTDLDIDSIELYGKPLQGKYKHYCREFDYLPVDENCFEFKFCLCFESTDEVRRLQDEIVVPE